MNLRTGKRKTSIRRVLPVMVMLLILGGLSASFSVLAGEILVDKQEDIKACYTNGAGCSSCRVQTVADLRAELSFIDILDAKVRRAESNNSVLVMELKVADPVPSLPGPLTSYSFALDLDGDPDTGFRADQAPLGVFPDLGVDLWVNLSLYKGNRTPSIFIGPHNIKNLDSTSGIMAGSLGKNRRSILFSVPIGRIERKLSFAYLHVRPEFKLELKKTKWVAFTTRATVQYPGDNPMCDFLPDRYFKESSEKCLLSPAVKR